MQVKSTFKPKSKTPHHLSAHAAQQLSSFASSLNDSELREILQKLAARHEKN